MKSTQTIGSAIPWRVGIEVATDAINQLVYADGVPVTPIRIAKGYIVAHGRTIAEARERVGRILPNLYNEAIKRIRFFNTEPYNPRQGNFDPLPGLTQRTE